MNYFLGIDIGTTSAKAIAFSQTGEVLASFSLGYEMRHPQPNHSEQDSDEILDAVINGINNVVKALSPHLPLCISFSAAMHSLLAVDEKGNLLLPCLIWADNRAAQIADKLRNSADGEWIYHATGVPVHAMSPLCKLLWLKENEPEMFGSAYKFLGIKEYIFFRLFGEFVVDTSIASATGLLNTASLQWDEQVLNFVGIDSSRLSAVVSVKQAFYYRNLHSELSLPATILFIIGASDGALSNLGTGGTDLHAMAITIGTSGAARMVITEPATDSRMRTFCYHLKDHYYIAGGGNNNGAVVLQWLKETLLQTNENYEELFDLADTVKPGSDNLLFLPYILGERAPLWNSDAKGVFFGLSIQHAKAHLIRSAVEGVVYCLYSVGKILAEKYTISALHASGGFAKSSSWLQILADVFNSKVFVSGAVESSALGAVMVGAEALGLRLDFQNKILAVYEPNASNYLVYKKSFEKFDRIYALLKEEMINEDETQS